MCDQYGGIGTRAVSDNIDVNKSYYYLKSTNEKIVILKKRTIFYDVRKHT